jgi:hypothetical protein
MLDQGEGKQKMIYPDVLILTSYAQFRGMLRSVVWWILTDFSEVLTIQSSGRGATPQKTTIFRILLVLLHGCEVRSLNERKIKLRVFHNKALRTIFGPKIKEVTIE